MSMAFPMAAGRSSPLSSRTRSRRPMLGLSRTIVTTARTRWVRLLVVPAIPGRYPVEHCGFGIISRTLWDISKKPATRTHTGEGRGFPAGPRVQKQGTPSDLRRCWVSCDSHCRATVSRVSFHSGTWPRGNESARSAVIVFASATWRQQHSPHHCRGAGRGVDRIMGDGGCRDRTAPGRQRPRPAGSEPVQGHDA